jgi:prepilin-type N-terminal cleavage/methylation domain-containing protein
MHSLTNLLHRVGRLLTPRRFAAAGCRGFTLLEVQVASVVFVLAVVFLIGQARTYRSLLESMERDSALGGVAVAGDDRVIASVSRPGGGGAPVCEVELHSIEQNGFALDAEVVVTRRSP